MKPLIAILFCVSLGMWQEWKPSKDSPDLIIYDGVSGKQIYPPISDSLHNAKQKARLEEMRELREQVRRKAQSGRSDIFESVLPDGKPLTLITLEDMLEYQAECWADSTLQNGYWIYLDGNDVWVPRRDNLVHTQWRQESKWIHRTPTFEGFILWMKRKKE